MIQSKSDLQYYLEMDKKALGYNKKRPGIFCDDTWRFQIALRKHEYYMNTRVNVFLDLFYTYRHYIWGRRLGFEIPCNVFGPGLRISHHGCVVVNAKAKIGAFCEIYHGATIGEWKSEAPVIGDHVWIGPGAKVIGGIEIGDYVMIGANAVVTHSFKEHTTLVGIPARVLKHEGNVYVRGDTD